MGSTQGYGSWHLIARLGEARGGPSSGEWPRRGRYARLTTFLSFSTGKTDAEDTARTQTQDFTESFSRVK